MSSSYQFVIMINNNQDSKKIALILKSKLQKAKMKENQLHPDIVFIIGGDGTFLKAVNKYNQQLDKIKFITFKQGNIGFYHNFVVSQIDEVVKDLVQGDKLIINELDLLEIEINNRIIYAINEFRLVNFAQVLKCDVFINDELLQAFSGSGIIIATKTGTSGLMKVTGGAIILANSKLMEYQELFAVDNNIYHSIKAPLILDQSQIITLKLTENPKEKLNKSQLIVDTFNFHDKLVKEVKIKISSQSLKIFAFKSNNISIINKLNKSFIKFN